MRSYFLSNILISNYQDCPKIQTGRAYTERELYDRLNLGIGDMLTHYHNHIKYEGSGWSFIFKEIGENE